MLKALSDFLRSNKERIVRTHAVLTEDWNPTYGLGDPRSTTISEADWNLVQDAITQLEGV